MTADVETAIIANTAAWWDYRGDHVHPGLMDKDTVLDKGGLNWRVSLVPIEWYDEDTGYRFLVRDDTQTILDMVGSRYQPVQNDRLAEYMTELVQTGDLEFESGLSLSEGKIVTLCARRPDHVTVAGEANVPYLTGANWHSRDKRMVLFFSFIRTVCRNTLRAGMHNAQNVFSISHTAGQEARMADIRKQLEVGFTYTDELAKLGNELAGVKMSVREFEGPFINAVVPDPDETGDKDVDKNNQRIMVRDRGKLREVYKDTPDLENIKGTRWGALQGVMQWDTHKNVNYRTPDNKFKNLVLANSPYTQRAFDYLRATT